MHELLLVQVAAVVEIKGRPGTVDERLINIVPELLRVLARLCLADAPRFVCVNLLEDVGRCRCTARHTAQALQCQNNQ